MTESERIHGLRRLGYGESEARFLSLAALHGGYFLRRQFALFIGRKDGGSVTELVQKALAQDHVRSTTWHQKTQIYHLCSRPFYEALGQGENRNRRAREALAIKNKLMGFDFVLAHRHARFLATEQEKFGYFIRTLHLDASVLPAKLYRPAKSSTVPATARYFVDKYPMFLASPSEVPVPSPAPPVSFCFVDEGTVSLSRFENYLAQYGLLFSSLPQFHLIYIAANNRHFRDAERVFENFVRRELDDGHDAGHSTRERLLEYFEARRLYEGRQLASFDRAKLIRLREEKREFSSDKYETLYAGWKSVGEQALLHNLPTEPIARPLIHGSFSTFLLEYNYGFFGRFLG